MIRLHIKPEWCAHDSTADDRRTWAAEVSAVLACGDCVSNTGSNKLGKFSWPPTESDMVVTTSKKAIEGAAGQALAYAGAQCMRNCSIELAYD